MIDLTRAENVQNVLYGNGSGKTVAMLMVVLDACRETGDSISVIGYNLYIAEMLCVRAMDLAEELGIPVERVNSHELKMKESGGVIYFGSKHSKRLINKDCSVFNDPVINDSYIGGVIDYMDNRFSKSCSK